ncbi:MAG TPA: hypothetical protein VLX44_16270 [Xanthobacteraceae bacterium]|nr:hypothetical protein [Xanthobacteraceae bacterium]
MAVVISCLATAADAAPQKAKTHAAPPSREALYQQCRQEAFRKFGWHNGSQTVLYTDFLVEQTDLCVRNGGHF